MAHPKNEHERLQQLQQQRAAHLANLRKMVGKAVNDNPPKQVKKEHQEFPMGRKWAKAKVLGGHKVHRINPKAGAIQDFINFQMKKNVKNIQRDMFNLVMFGDGPSIKQAPEGPKSVFQDHRTFKTALEKRGYVCLGYGYYSSVMAKPGSDRVIKIGRSANADGWPDYVHWAAKEGYAGTFAPKVFSYKVIKGGTGDFSVAVVERLQKTLTESYGEDGDEESGYFTKKTRTVAANDNALVADLFTRSAKRNHELSTTLLDLVVPKLGIFARKLGERFKGAGLDLHGANMMLRKDGTICVTDPIARYEQSANYKRLKAMDFVPLAA